MKREDPSLRRRAAFAPSSFRETPEGFREVELRFTYEPTSTVIRRTWSGEVYREALDLSPGAIMLGRLNSGAPFLRVHDQGDDLAQIGKIVEGTAKREEGPDGVELSAIVRFSRNLDEAGERIVRDIQDGIRRNVSVGYRVHAEDHDESPEDGGPPIYRATLWEPLEVSAVPIGADAGAQFRSHDTAQEGPTMSTKHAPGAPQDAGPDNTAAKADSYTAEDLERARAEAAADAEARARAAERARAAALDQVRMLDLPADWKPSEDASADQIRAEAFAALAERQKATQTAPQVEVGRTDGEKVLDGMAGALAATLIDWRGVSPEARRAILGGDDPEVEGSPSRRYYGRSPLDLARVALSRMGETRAEGATRAGLADLALRGDPEAVALALRGAHRPDAALRVRDALGFQTTAGFPNVLADVMHMALRAGYEAEIRTFPIFARRTTAPDFRRQYDAQLSEAPDLLPVTEAGEYKRATLTDSKSHWSLTSYGREMGVTRKVLINDQFNAIVNAIQDFGASGARLEGDEVYNVFTDAAYAWTGDDAALFSSGRGNLEASGAAPDVDTLIAMIKAFATRTGMSGSRIRPMRMAYVLGGYAVMPAIERALGLVREAKAPTTDANTTPQMLSAVTPVLDPRFDAAAAPNAWFGLAASRTLAYGYLEGEREGVRLEQIPTMSTDGIAFRASMDFGVKVEDPKAFHKNPGA